MRRTLTAALLTLTIAGGVAVNAAVSDGGPSQTSATTAEPARPVPAMARRIADESLRAIDTGSYAAFSARWSPAMKSAIGADTFAAFRTSTRKKYGNYVRIIRMTQEPAKTPGTVNYAAVAQFERGRAALWLNFDIGGTEVNGSRLLPAT